MDDYTLLMLFTGIYTILLFNMIHNFRQSKKTHDLIENLETIVSNTTELNRVTKMMKNIGGLDSIEGIDKGDISIKKSVSSISPGSSEKEEIKEAPKETPKETPLSDEPPLAKLLRERKEQ